MLAFVAEDLSSDLAGSCPMIEPTYLGSKLSGVVFVLCSAWDQKLAREFGSQASDLLKDDDDDAVRH